MNTYEEYVAVFNSVDGPQGHRRGQHAFNLLYVMHPDLANKVRGTDLDPFYRDHRIPAFLIFVQQHWEEN